eukprot:CAMPEP_0206556398 /NCGR_PEP_ID=MMETSP0325_2-20121206/18401_1 /ASSEMBLY_ACC=CAM_ASM_000347 /TAXON_ID=2866 /ORGANISM="Crypthecodinium cohnii, Strain Seligo" /LENGTH=33 /DNA_ID= /DNA_START= /DNA_END= /DNA_ORIENTATION=
MLCVRLSCSQGRAELVPGEEGPGAELLLDAEEL